MPCLVVVFGCCLLTDAESFSCSHVHAVIGLHEQLGPVVGKDPELRRIPPYVPRCKYIHTDGYLIKLQIDLFLHKKLWNEKNLI